MLVAVEEPAPPMNTRLTILVLLVAAMLVGGAGGTPVAIPDSTPPTIAQLKAKIARQANRISDQQDTIANLRDERDAQDGVIADQNETITRLRARDPLDAILARDPDGQWAAMLALWRAFPTLPEGALCGYDKATVPDSGIGLTLTSFEFLRISGC